MSVVVLYFFPVRELLAVTLTPGRGMLPSLTVPWMVPPGENGGAGSGAAGAAGGRPSAGRGARQVRSGRGRSRSPAGERQRGRGNRKGCDPGGHRVNSAESPGTAVRILQAHSAADRRAAAATLAEATLAGLARRHEGDGGGEETCRSAGRRGQSTCRRP